MECKREKIIGSMFGCRPHAEMGVVKPPPFVKSGRSIYFSHARGGVSWLVRQLELENIWVPSYLCPSILSGIDDSLVRFFAVDDNLEPVGLSWLEHVGRRDLVCVIDYFGREWGENIKHASQEQEAWVLEDASQALLTDGLGQDADFLLYSPRKFIGVPDGGILVDQKGVFCKTPDLERPPADWWIPQLNAWVLRGQFDRDGANSEDRSWYRLYRKAKENAPSEPCSMSELTRRLIGGSFDYATISEKRRQNYQFLIDNTEFSSVLGRLKKEEVPVGFATNFTGGGKRDRIKNKLINNFVYPPIHWSIGGCVPKKYKGSHVLSKKILTIPCDQRYNISDMKRISSLLDH